MKTKYTPLFFIFIIMIYSIYNNLIYSEINPIYQTNYIKQTIFFIIGFLLIFLINKTNINKLLKYHYIYYIISIVLLILVLLIGTEINGAKAWFNLYFFSFQPSELVKLTLAITLSYVTIKYNKKKNNEILFLIKIILLTLIPSILVFIEPDTGAIIFYLIIYLTAFFYAKINKLWYYLFFLICILCTGATLILYFKYQDILINLIGTSFFYRIDRLINLTDNYQINNALTLIGSSSYFGAKNSLYVPEAHTDFMFAYNFGNFGLFGAISITLTYFSLLITLFKQSNNSNNKIFSKSICYILFFGIVYNILMNVGIIPIMGIPLPFLSYGGSSIIIYFIFLGLHFKYLDN